MKVNTHKQTRQLNLTTSIMILLLSLISIDLFAESVTTTLNVSATITGNSCSFIVDNMSFGNYVGTELTATASLSVDCGGESINWIMMASDGGNSGSANNRYMLGGLTSNQLNYQIYSDLAHTIPYDAGTQISGIGDRLSSTAFYGLIPAGQSLITDNYNDSIVITLSF